MRGGHLGPPGVPRYGRGGVGLQQPLMNPFALFGRPQLPGLPGMPGLPGLDLNEVSSN